MKLSDRNSAVHFLLDGDPVRFGVSKDSTEIAAAVAFMKKEFPVMKPRFRNRVQYLSQTFKNAYFKAKDKLLKVLLEEPVKQSGTFIIPVSEGKTYTVFYDLETAFVGDSYLCNGRVVIFYKEKELGEPRLVFFTDVGDNDTVTFLEFSAIRDGFDDQSTVSDILGLILFVKYCEVEVKVVEAGKKAVHEDEKYFNETGWAIEILDSTWFTTIVRGEGFLVGDETGGFFRWQPVGPGRLEKRIVWIAPFEKKGYVRKAKVLKGRE